MESRWLARSPRFRLDAELIRDTDFTIAGLLEHELGDASSVDRVTKMFRLGMAREPKNDELKIVTELFERTQIKGSSEEASWTLLANVLLNLDETITKD